MTVYATVDDLADYVDTVPTTAPILLRRASRDIDNALLCAVYDPTDTAVQAALREATCEQAAGYVDNGQRRAQPAKLTSFGIGSVTASRGKANPDDPPAKVGRLWYQAWQVLQLAGLTGQGPMQSW